ncbi:phosphatidylinositol 5-phosphate 4-kinase type-2 alpha-like [Daphnia carinata]|uniref:phosphatidylinositol 5-phosphate 4-kinase type-2 alpha-like n=1 Tax=Daphnia carinata TaxID=120202 RepID=UPI002580ACA2|nr:phosphatidylinositol 5-phosphate 4-kinase type-2 alpha-like [Daphnia carinata]
MSSQNSTAIPVSMPSIKLKKKHIRVKHQKVKLFRASEPILSVFMWGINHTIKELVYINIPVMLMPNDFKAYSKVKVDNHLFNKENMPSHFKIKEYCPLVFRNLRERFAIDDSDYRQSLTRSQPVISDSPGRSGAKFYNSSDGLFVIKTLTREEVEQMHLLLKEYHPYIVERHGKTLLPQYLGMYRLTVDGVENYLVVTRNVFSNRLPLHRKYDLKGSTVDREASEKEKEKELPTLKDNDFVKDGTKVVIGEDARERLMETLTADVEFLMKLQMMDYSLLLGVHDCKQAEQENKEILDRPEQTDFVPAAEDSYNEDDEDSCGSTVGVGGATGPTPPDSPQMGREKGRAARSISQQYPHQYTGKIIPELDIYAIPCKEDAPNREIYFLALIDILTHYGVKKQAAKAAKTVKYGSHVDGISTVEPDQYGRRFLDFMAKVIE